MLDDFKATLGKRGLAKPTLFLVKFKTVPSIMYQFEGVNEITSDMHFFAESAEFPGTQLLTQEHRYYDMPSKYVYAKAHDDLNITFRLDRDFNIKRFFDGWVNSMYNPETGNVYYKNVYAGQIEVHQLMENGDASYGIELIDLFPTSIGQISVGWDQSGSYSKLPVTFSFKKIKIIPPEDLYVRESGERNFDSVDTILPNVAENVKSKLDNIKDDASNILQEKKTDLESGLRNTIMSWF